MESLMSDPRTGRAPATPLIVHDPFLSVWSITDELTGSWPTHWTGQNQSMCGMVRIDGAPFRFMGLVTRSGKDIPAMRQTRREVAALGTTYAFEANGVELTLTFTTPTLPDDLELLARPVSYVDVALRAIDGKTHRVETYLDWSTNWVIGTPERQVIWGRHRAGEVEAMFLGAAQQTPLGRSGDEVQIDWGYLFLSAEPGAPTRSAFGEVLTLREGFADTGDIPARDDVRLGRPLSMPAVGHRGPNLRADGIHQDRQSYNVAAWLLPSTEVGSTPIDWRMLVAYDQVFAIDYFHRHLTPYWSRNGQSAIGLVEAAWADRDSVCARARAFGDDLLQKLVAAGGDTYARLGLLAFRQTLGAHALVADIDGKLLYFSKENGSNGCLGTVDLTYPSAPFYLEFAPELLEAQMRPICAYAAGGRWPFPYAPHDVGQFPLANGQVYGGGELTERNQMPYEESGNMLILAAALAEKTNDDRFAREFWPQLETWAKYLVTSGIDPDNQLCTDDFAGHLPHNANLSLKAIVGIGAYGLLCRRLGLSAEAERHLALAKDWAGRWPALAAGDPAYRLAFDQPGTWSQKYNLIWDRLLGLGLFPSSIAEREMAFYRTQADRFGLPLDSRAHHTKLDWLVWSACLTGRQEDFDALIAPLAVWLDNTPARVPLSDWFDTTTGRQTAVGGFRARSVVGGIFIKLLLDRGSLGN
jgi:hypothetical protein